MNQVKLHFLFWGLRVASYDFFWSLHIICDKTLKVMPEKRQKNQINFVSSRSHLPTFNFFW